MIKMTTTEAISIVNQAKSAAVLFGSDPKKVYHELAQSLHPDKVSDKKATSAFQKLTDLYDSINKPKKTTIGKWEISDPLAKGDICDLYYANSDDMPELVFKIAQSPRDADLLEREYVSLTKLHNATENNFKKYLPKIVGRLEASNRRANVLSLETGKTLADVMELFPEGLDMRHAVWIANRALNALGFVHHEGIVHGSLIPEHLLIGPISHSLSVLDWCYSSPLGGKIPAIVKNRKGLYPPEVLRKQPATEATDIYMLFASLRLAVGDKMPKRFKPIFDLALAGPPKSRPSEAWQLIDRWLELAEKEYGPSKYTKLEIPTN